MNIYIDQDERYETIEMTITCPSIDQHLQQLIDQIKTFDLSFQGKKPEGISRLKANTILYIEAVDNKTFLYTKDQHFESPLKLYEIEKIAAHTNFLRISKSTILNIEKVRSVRALFNGKFEATLSNEERLIINRHYVKAFKKKF